MLKRRVSIHHLRRMLRQPRGASLVEYIIGATVVGLALIAIVMMFSGSVQSGLERATQEVDSMAPETDEFSESGREQDEASIGVIKSGDTRPKDSSKTRAERRIEQSEGIEITFWEGLNIWVVLLMLFLLGLLGYVMVKSNKE